MVLDIEILHDLSKLKTNFTEVNTLAFKLDVNPGDLFIETVAPRNWTYEQLHR